VPPGKTQADRLLDLERAVAGIDKQLVAAEKAADALGHEHQKTRDLVIDLRRKYEVKIAGLEKDLEDLRRWRDDQMKERDEWARRVWAFGPSALITLLFTYLIRR